MKCEQNKREKCWYYRAYKLAKEKINILEVKLEYWMEEAGQYSKIVQNQLKKYLKKEHKE